MMLSEAYPELKANTQFLKLHDNLSEIEDKEKENNKLEF